MVVLSAGSGNPILSPVAVTLTPRVAALVHSRSSILWQRPSMGLLSRTSTLFHHHDLSLRLSVESFPLELLS